MTGRMSKIMQITKQHRRPVILDKIVQSGDNREGLSCLWSFASRDNSMCVRERVGGFLQTHLVQRLWEAEGERERPAQLSGVDWPV